jgi:hypothetical protein
VLTFKEARTPALWQEFQSLLKLAPENRLVVHLPDQTRQTFRWANDLEPSDEQGRRHKLHALICQESGPAGEHTFAWVTDFRLHPNNVCAIARQGGRVRCNIENQGFNIQKNSGLNLEHAYSTDPDVMKAFYYLLQIAHLFLQMFEMGSLLRGLAKDYQDHAGRTLRQPQEHRPAPPGMSSLLSTWSRSFRLHSGPDPLGRSWVAPPLEAIQTSRPPNICAQPPWTRRRHSCRQMGLAQSMRPRLKPWAV